MITSAWIGYTDDDTEGKWTWADTGKKEAENTYTNWLAGEGSSGEDENCASMNDKDGQWKDQSCEERMSFFCGFRKFNNTFNVYVALNNTFSLFIKRSQPTEILFHFRKKTFVLKKNDWLEHKKTFPSKTRSCFYIFQADLLTHIVSPIKR